MATAESHLEDIWEPQRMLTCIGSEVLYVIVSLWYWKLDIISIPEAFFPVFLGNSLDIGQILLTDEEKVFGVLRSCWDSLNHEVPDPVNPY